MPTPEVAVSDEEADAAVRLAETLTSDIAELREEETFRLEAVSEALGTDPLLLALDGLKTQKEAVDAQIRRLPAYGREFHGSHLCGLEELARHSGYTFSAVRTGYGDKEIQAVAEQRQGAGRIPCARSRRWPRSTDVRESATAPLHGSVKGRRSRSCGCGGGRYICSATVRS
ncbi:hypothetical protein [Streptomyces cinereoruber]|uniref:hypothetical protein n=1 Tax=Streptomyces cinereoruber TaxID=67260 RepID=UPI003631A560